MGECSLSDCADVHRWSTGILVQPDNSVVVCQYGGLGKNNEESEGRVVTLDHSLKGVVCIQPLWDDTPEGMAIGPRHRRSPYHTIVMCMYGTIVL